ncbi:sigma-70 family RNA polymerase sigma factor [Actinocrispum sp. NPDC049592]|uniref:sigma-70 family RNA polymerase sigma factor n=1 Tax=Actinocrispum sp. NPDC049592 TaxID=3154835 RepID=UPI003449A121
MTEVDDLDRFRPELLRLCYRLLGSVHDAEDAVQESYLRAWRSLDQFDGRASLGTWLYRIATNVCLRQLETAGRRPLPSGMDHPGMQPVEVPWLEPFPTDPAMIVEERDSLRLALIAALQFLPPRQRAVLILRDVLHWRAVEVASALETSTAAVNSLLQRARTQLAEAGLTETDVTYPLDEHQRRLIDRYAAAFERADIDDLVLTLTEDAAWEMPPNPMWFAGRAAIGGFLKAKAVGNRSSIRTEANGQPAVAVYNGDGSAHSIHVLTVTSQGISRSVVFLDVTVFDLFGLPRVLSHIPAARCQGS